MIMSWEREFANAFGSEKVEQFVHIPFWARERLARYILRGEYPGEALDHLLRGDLFAFCESASAFDQIAIRKYVQFLKIAAPSECYGSDEAVYRWRLSGGANGLPA